MYFIAENLDRFFYWIEERHAIYLRRQRGDSWPWTEDYILQTYKFTNVFRELDAGTIYCREAIREPYADHKELFFNVASYRLYNLIDSHKDIGFIDKHYDPCRAMDLMYERKETGKRVFTGAHMITGTLGGDKIFQIFDICLCALWKNRRKLEPQPGDALEQAFNRLNKHSPGFGPFISYEVITDLRWTRYLENASDIMTWANPGPGAKRGINLLYGLPINDHLKPEDYIEAMRYLLSISKNKLPAWIPNLEMRDVEHSTCEFFKYEKTRLGLGRPRSKFVPPHLR